MNPEIKQIINKLPEQEKSLIEKFIREKTLTTGNNEELNHVTILGEELILTEEIKRVLLKSHTTWNHKDCNTYGNYFKERKLTYLENDNLERFIQHILGKITLDKLFLELKKQLNEYEILKEFMTGIINRKEYLERKIMEDQYKILTLRCNESKNLLHILGKPICLTPEIIEIISKPLMDRSIKEDKKFHDFFEQHIPNIHELTDYSLNMLVQCSINETSADNLLKTLLNEISYMSKEINEQTMMLSYFHEVEEENESLKLKLDSKTTRRKSI
jgi:hypothetical protein